MAEVYFQFNKIAYLYDIKQTKLYQIKKETLTEIKEPKILKTIRFRSTEINEKQEFKLAHRLDN